MASRRPRRCRGKTPGGDQQRPPVERCPAAEVGAGRRADGRSGGEAVGARLVAEEDQPRGRAVELTEHGVGAGAADELEPPPVDEHGVVRPGAKEGVLDELCGGWPARLGGEMWSGDGEKNLDACAAAQRPPPPTPALAPARRPTSSGGDGGRAWGIRGGWRASPAARDLPSRAPPGRSCTVPTHPAHRASTSGRPPARSHRSRAAPVPRWLHPARREVGAG